MIYGLSTEWGYATPRAFRCVISASWDLIKITASKIAVKWKLREDKTPHIPTQNVSIPSLEKYELLRVCMAADRSSLILFSFDTWVVFFHTPRDDIPFQEERKKSLVKMLQKTHLESLPGVTGAWLPCHGTWLLSCLKVSCNEMCLFFFLNAETGCPPSFNYLD